MKSNYGKRGYALKLRIDEVLVPELPPGEDGVPTIRVVGPSDARMEDAIGERKKPGQPAKLDQAMLLLAVELAGGARPTTEIEELAEAKGISKRTLKTARKDLGVEAFKEAFDGPWWLRLTQGAIASPGDPGSERVAPFDETRSSSGIESARTSKAADPAAARGARRAQSADRRPRRAGREAARPDLPARAARARRRPAAASASWRPPPSATSTSTGGAGSSGRPRRRTSGPGGRPCPTTSGRRPSPACRPGRTRPPRR